MAATNPGDLHGQTSASRPLFFNSAQPTMTAIQTGLAVLCFLLVVRFCLQRCVSWRHMSRARCSSHTQETQEQAQPPLPILDGKMGTMPRSYCDPDSTEQRGSADDSDGSKPFAAHRALPGRQQRRFLTRLRPAPPLTPPELSSTIFACDEDVDGFISQPNPDYMSATSSTPFQPLQPTPDAHSYMSSVTMGAPLPDGEDGASRQAFGPGSFHLSPVLPPPPPGSQSQIRAHDDDTPHRNVGVRGEIISVVNEAGHGWTRHTRVYGGGVCRACAASGGHEGGFYGATVTPEEMRY
ncbi:hypothetical protein CCM_09598 [Cordyceps militaris CM01]|uniref:Uncharacterized protein n=1 Tax=Cordyceps militaris (strain CM01) TaxID=983644 RepID=G3JUV7_CORMM|nr:uncharacterized protein CCM_09598 [Cordyceps militaris CM01]EGX87637.1 hypothetical protein CCM_09598 [Cordyceps militaris CM01]